MLITNSIQTGAGLRDMAYSICHKYMEHRNWNTELGRQRDTLAWFLGSLLTYFSLKSKLFGFFSPLVFLKEQLFSRLHCFRWNSTFNLVVSYRLNGLMMAIHRAHTSKSSRYRFYCGCYFAAFLLKNKETHSLIHIKQWASSTKSFQNKFVLTQFFRRLWYSPIFYLGFVLR